MDTTNSVMVTGGTGSVGSYAVLFLAMNPAIDKLWIVCRDSLKAHTVRNNAIIAGAIHGAYAKIEVVSLDLLNKGPIVTFLKKKKPRIVLNAAAMISIYPYFPRLKAKQKSLGYISGSAHFLPKDLALLHPLMEAVKESGIDTKVINLAAPDIAPTVLEKVGLCPTVGAGTIDLTVQGLRQSIAGKLNISMRDVSIEMVAQHAVRRFPPERVPHYLKVYVKGDDVSDELRLNEIVSEAADTSGVETSSTPNTTNAPITAASAARNVLAMLSNGKTYCHASGVDGLPGGFPVALSSSGAEICVPNGLTREDILDMNTEGMRVEGVETIETDGTIVMTEYEQGWVREGLGLNWERIHLSRIREMADELIHSYQNL
jgi:hypothetical protein